jgi:hypothetical protein
VLKAFNAFSGPLKRLVKGFKRFFKGLSKASKTPLKGVLKALTGLYRPLKCL